MLLPILALIAAAQDNTTVPPAPPPSASEKKICQSETATGSMFSKRVCHTRAEWDAIAQQRSASVDRARSSRGNN
jgi:hypothetical protein